MPITDHTVDVRNEIPRTKLAIRKGNTPEEILEAAQPHVMT